MFLYYSNPFAINPKLYIVQFELGASGSGSFGGLELSPYTLAAFGYAGLLLACSSSANKTL